MNLLISAGEASGDLYASLVVAGDCHLANGAIVEGATVAIENLDKGAKAIQTKTNKKGEYIQVGLYPGKYRITISKDALTFTKETDVHLDMATLDATRAVRA